MKYWVAVWVIFAVQGLALSKYEDCDESAEGECLGQEYSCLNGLCQCASGYVPASPSDYACVPCPGYMQKCWGYCCSGRQSLQCWQGYCQQCYDRRGNWICADQINSQVLISATQIAMGTALVLGLLATFVLIYKLCATPDVRTLGTQAYGGGSDPRLSLGSMQLYVEQRLRDAPPRYTRPSPSCVPPSCVPAVFPLHGYLNAGFSHDSSVPPPPYTEDKEEDTRRPSATQPQQPPPTVHM